MTETLESSGFSKHQSDAVIQSMALAMNTFAVTPELLDDRFSQHKKAMRGILSEYKDESNRRLDEIHELQRSQLRYFLAFTLVIIAGFMGAVGAVLAS